MAEDHNNKIDTEKETISLWKGLTIISGKNMAGVSGVIVIDVRHS